ncbi:MAG: hypothetical protein ACLR7G_00640 [[Clostridium] symbiosum]|nr:hypothetical protein [Hungatella effluvii]
MKFKEKDIHLRIDGIGIVSYSPETNRNIPEGCNFLKKNIQKNRWHEGDV